MQVNRVQQKAAELNKLAAEADGLQKRYSAHLMLYDAACMMPNNEAEIAQRRDECHTLLDAILDNTRSVHFVSRELHNLMHG